MFSNLIESGSHAADLKRKGRFFLGTTLFYALLFAATGIGSIYAYNVRMDERTDYEVLALMHFPPAEARSAPARREQSRPASSPVRSNQIASRTEVVMQTPYPARVAAPNAREVPTNASFVIGPLNTDPAPGAGVVGPYAPGVAGPASNSGRLDGPSVVDVGEAPTPTPRPTPATMVRQDSGPVRLASSVISSKVVEKPAPPYPQIAKVAGIEGPVAVQILIDEQGRVISAKATSGNPLLQSAAVQAAYKARFTPTLLTGRPVKVTGSITYNFVLH
ncbi:MAG: periplasmic protein TonB [Acidobacteriota bacterium]|jgi:protein TonB|nr:periplasmic protein TonB [Acidobacteriota bacterium]